MAWGLAAWCHFCQLSDFVDIDGVNTVPVQVTTALVFFMLYSICGDYFNLAGIDIGDWAVFVPSGTLSGVTILCEYPVCTSLSFVFLASHSLITFISFTGTSLFPSFHYSIPPSEAVQYYGYLSA